MYTARRHFYPRGIEGEAMDCTFKEFADIDKAIKYAHRYAKGNRFAGVQVEDGQGKIVYEITSDFEVIEQKNGQKPGKYFCKVTR